jgi:selenophosphate synthetase-related protein
MSSLESLAAALREHPNVVEKLCIAAAYAPALPVAQQVLIGDDAAAIPDGDGYLLLAAEGMMESFISFDPWFAGYCAVMVNLSDIAAMGGRPTAIVDVLWAHTESPVAAEIWAGTLISSFEAKPAHQLLMAVDLRASYRGENTVFWNASVGSPPERLRGDLALLAELAEGRLVTAGKDISNGGLLGTLAMLLATSRCGATVNLDALPMPPGVDLKRWLLSFPSYGYLLSVTPEASPAVCARFHERGIACQVIGDIEEGDGLMLSSGVERCFFAQIVPAASVHPAMSP